MDIISRQPDSIIGTKETYVVTEMQYISETVQQTACKTVQLNKCTCIANVRGIQDG